MSLVDYPLFSWVVVLLRVLLPRAEHVGEREGYSKDYTLYQRLTVQKNDLLMMSFPKARNM